MDGRSYLLEDSTLTNIFTEYIDLKDLKYLLECALSTMHNSIALIEKTRLANDLILMELIDEDIRRAERLLNDIEDTRRRLDMGGDENI